MPLLSGSTLHALVDHHSASGSAVTVITANLANPTGYGRILRGADDSVEGIVEHKDATPEQLAITEINSGIYAFDAQVLRDALEHVTTDNSQGEKYLTDVLAIARSRVGAWRRTSSTTCGRPRGSTTASSSHGLGKELNRRITEKWMREGVTIVDPDTTWIDADVAIGRDATILPGTQLLGATTIGADAVIGPDSTLEDTEVGERATISRTESRLAVVGADATVGPFSYLRPGTELGAKGKIGGFVETKNAKIGEGAKVPHLTYCGDATIARAPTSAPARSSPTTTGWPSTTPPWVRTASSARTPC